MNVIAIILVVAAFLGGQVWLVSCLRKLDRFLEDSSDHRSANCRNDRCRCPDEDVVE